jgi:hypothetical protein
MIKPTTHFSALPLSARLTYTMTLLVLGLGYLFAIIHVFASHAGRDGDAGLSVNDLIIAYSGSPADTRLEAALKGPMQGMLPEGERAEIIAWVRRGAESAEFGKVVEPVLKERCQSCHDGSNPHIPTLKSAEDVAKLTVRDTGMDIFTLVRVSHIHLFGITFIFFITSSIFSHAWLRPLWLKCAIIAVPFVSIILDIASWYLTKLWPGFAWIVMISGGFMGLSFAAQMLISLWQMWTHFTPRGLGEDGELPHIR